MSTMAQNFGTIAEGCSHSTMGGWKRKQRNKTRGSQTPGKMKRKDTCQLTPIGGVSRKAWTSARAYKRRNYMVWCAFGNKVNGGSSS